MRLGLFPGQGVPARAVLAALPAGDPTLQRASDLLGYDLRKRVEQVARRQKAVMPTSLAQPAIFTASLAAFASHSGETFDCYLGHSVGEYAALVAGAAMTFDHGLDVVKVRGEAMERASLAAAGGMVVILDLTLAEAEAVAEDAGVTVANDNSPRQIVLAGDHDRLAVAASSAVAKGGRAVRLDVAGPFHTARLAPATPSVRAALDQIEIRLPQVMVVSNVSASGYRAPGEIRELLTQQFTTRVRFREALEGLWRKGVTDFHDFGPGKVVAGLAARTFDALRTGSTAAVG